MWKCFSIFFSFLEPTRCLSSYIVHGHCWMIIGSILDIGVVIRISSIISPLQYLALAEKYLQHPPQYCLFHVHVLPSSKVSEEKSTCRKGRPPHHLKRLWVRRLRLRLHNLRQPQAHHHQWTVVSNFGQIILMLKRQLLSIRNVLFQTCSGRRGLRMQL